jgi:hypothetical protein
MKFKLVLISFATLFLFNSCLKVGEDDPGISFRTRLTRLVGDWKVTSYKFNKIDDWAPGPYSNNYTIVGSTYTSIFTDDSGTITKTGTETWDWTLTKDGKFTNTCIIDGLATTYDGIWRFNNESTVHVSQTSNPPNSRIYTGFLWGNLYHLKELRNKKMVWTQAESSESGGYNFSLDIEIVLEAK